MKIFSEFKEFAVKGNVFDMAVGVVIGTAFGKITASLVKDILMPACGFMVGKADFAKLKLVIHPEELDASGKVINTGVVIEYGNFLQEVQLLGAE